MKQKTAIRQLIEYLNETIEVINIVDSPQLTGLKAALEVVIKKSKELEPVNEQQIVEAHDKGVFNSKLQQTVLYQNGEQYFNETFEKP